jgi:uncharacterized protein YhdP
MRSRRARIAALVALVIVLIGARAVLPIAIQRYVNRVLSRDETYVGRVGDVDVALIRGAYEIEDVRIDKRSGKVPVPFFAAEIVDLSIEWRALFDGSLVGEVEFLHPKVNFVAGSSSASSQAGGGVDWRDTVEDLFPFQINRVAVRDGEVHFRDFSTKPKVDVYLNHVELVATNLTNAQDVEDERVATVRMSAIPMNAGRLRARLRLDPFSKSPDFDLDGQVTGADLTQWNDFLRAYGKFDVERGSFSVYTELLAKGNRFDGYVKPFFKNIDVLRYEEEKHEQSLLSSVWEGLVGVTEELFDHQPNDRVATRIPVSGTVDDPRIGFWQTLGNVLRNAFLEAFVPQLEGSIGER